jgi:thiol-disulfide isomerase/thioredoxin
MLSQFKKLTAVACFALTAVSVGATAHAEPLKNPRPAPEFTGIDKWLNSTPLTMQQLRGKVVLVDFWTYTCINCINTLPYVKDWYQKYKDQGLVVVGVHTPEYPFERNTDNVKTAIKHFDIRYPVAQDNSYATWTAYNNQYWPGFYLIDKKGQVVYTHFGEGQYGETEAAIKALLAQKQ